MSIPPRAVRLVAGLLVGGFLFAGAQTAAQTRIMLVGDSITQGGQQHASYRYTLWQDLTWAGFDFDLVGQRDFTNDQNPNLAWYPEYYTAFDRDHEGYWGWRTDEIAAIIFDAATAAQPDVALIHLGTNDIGQMGAAGVTNANTYLRQIVDRLRSVRPDVTILLAQVIPIGTGSGYGGNAGQVEPLNTVIAMIAMEMATVQSPIVLVDQYTGFDLATMMQADELHPNTVGENTMAAVWQAALEPVLPGNPPPSVTLTTPADGVSLTAPVSILLAADATDSNGSVALVSFFVDGAALGTDTSPPFAIAWNGAPPGNYRLTALAQDDEGATRISAPVGVTVVPAAVAPITVLNPSFEIPLLDDGALAPGPGTLENWTFEGSANTYVGIFNPPQGSYPDADGDGTPAGADGRNVAYLFNNGGPAESVSATQELVETLVPGTEYFLTVAIGKFLPGQPYLFSTYGGYRIELLAGATLIASDSNSVDPMFGEFREALAGVASDDVDPSLIGEPLSIRLNLPMDEAPRSTHFDNVRLSLRAVIGAGRTPDGSDGTPLRIDRSGLQLILAWGDSCLPADSDYAIYEGTLGVFDSHAPRICATGDVSMIPIVPNDGDRYFLVVPHNSVREGSYGRNSNASERSPASITCLPQQIANCP